MTGLDPMQPAGERGPLTLAPVSSDLEAIFAGPVASEAPSAAESKVRAVSGRRRGRAAYATYGAVAAAGLLGLTAGSFLIRPSQARTAPPPETLAAGAAPVAAPQPPPAAQPHVLPVEVAAAPTVTLQPADGTPIGVADTEPVTEASQPARAHRAAAHRHASHGDLLAADRRLRAAYSHAVGAGVPRHVLVTYRDRWEDLRHDASWKPDRVAAGYGAMTADLERLARRSHGRREPPRHRLFGFFS